MIMSTPAKYLLSIIAVVFLPSVGAASVGINSCVTATVLQQTPKLGIVGVGPALCISLDVTANADTPGETVVVMDTASDFTILWGGMNDTDIEVAYTIRLDWSYSIVADLDYPNDSIDVFMQIANFQLETTGSLSGTEFIEFSGVVPPMFAIDAFESAFVSVAVTSIAPVPLPGAVWLFGCALIGLARVSK